jgi:hypothetical protein
MQKVRIDFKPCFYYSLCAFGKASVGKAGIQLFSVTLFVCFTHAAG